MNRIIFTLASLPSRSAHYVAFTKVEKIFEYLQREFVSPETLLMTFDGGQELPLTLKDLKHAVKVTKKSTTICGQIVIRDTEYNPKMSVLFNRVQP